MRPVYGGVGRLPQPPLFTPSCQRTGSTDARRISFEDTVRFEKIHEDTYRDFGFELISVEPRSLAERVRIITAAIG